MPSYLKRVPIEEPPVAVTAMLQAQQDLRLGLHAINQVPEYDHRMGHRIFPSVRKIAPLGPEFRSHETPPINRERVPVGVQAAQQLNLDGEETDPTEFGGNRG